MLHLRIPGLTSSGKNKLLENIGANSLGVHGYGDGDDDDVDDDNVAMWLWMVW